jgi:hypothetical protein
MVKTMLIAVWTRRGRALLGVGTSFDTIMAALLQAKNRFPSRVECARWVMSQITVG